MPTVNKSVSISEVYFEVSDIPILPTRTLLYNIEPYGKGTGTCESLKSYILRLADAHRISGNVFMQECLYQIIAEQNLNWPKQFNCINRLGSYTTIGKNKAVLLDTISKATGINGLNQTTMMPLRNIISTKGLITKQSRFCRQCVYDSVDNNKFFYPLIWEVACITACPIHGTKLEQHECGNLSNNHLKFPHKKVLPCVCPTCGSIGYRCEERVPDIASEVEIWKAKQVADLIANFSSANLPFTRQTIIDGLTSLCSFNAKSSLQLIAKETGIDKMNFHHWIQGSNCPSLPALLDICLYSKIDLVSLMQNSIKRCPSPSFSKTDRKPCARKPTLIEREQLLKDALSAVNPKSLTAISQEIALDASTLKHHFPELVSQIVKKYKSFIENLTQDRQINARKYVQESIRELTANGLPVTQRTLQNLSGKNLVT